jgi:hypothetical protein
MRDVREGEAMSGARKDGAGSTDDQNQKRSAGMTFILNPGDGHDVLKFETRREALIALEEAFSQDHNFAALYSHEAGTFRRYERGHWHPIDRGNLQVKVIEAARG